MTISATSSDTIYALSSAAGRAGVAVIRVSGPCAGRVLDVMTGGRPTPRMAVLRNFLHPQSREPIDRGLLLWMPGPATFTGEDVAELHVHGGRAVIQAMLAAIGQVEGCRLAEPGEFARRAFTAGKIDLTEAEGLADLIDAQTEAQRIQALRQAGGGLSSLYESWRSELISALALVEAAIDFSDEGDVSSSAMQRARELVAELSGKLAKHLDDGHRGEILREGLQVVLAGAPNVGKSSLLNQLARRDAAIVSAEAGTTRDAIEVQLDLEGLPIVITDTAGLRETDQIVEREGIRRSLQRADQADLIIWIDDAGQAPVEPPESIRTRAADTLYVVNKVDLAGEAQVCRSPEALAVSAKTGENLDILIKRIARVARERMAPREEPAVTQVRHRQHLEECQRHLDAFAEAVGDDGDELAELRAEELRLAAAALGRISGRVDVEDVLDAVFSRFCIGK